MKRGVAAANTKGGDQKFFKCENKTSRTDYSGSGESSLRCDADTRGDGKYGWAEKIYQNRLPCEIRLWIKILKAFRVRKVEVFLLISCKFVF